MAAPLMASDAFNARSKEKRQFSPDHVLTALEKSDLRWFFAGAEASFGVSSNFGQMQHELNRRAPSDEVLEELREEKRKRSRMRRLKYKPDQFSLINLALAVLGAAIERDPDSANLQADEALPEWAREYIHMHGDTQVFVANEPLANDATLAVVRQANHVRNRLVRTGNHWRGVLYAAYGPAARQAEIEAVGMPDHPANILGSPSLVPIALAWLEWRRQEDSSLPSAWEQLWSLGAARKVVQIRGGTGESVVEETREACSQLWTRAVDAYFQTRCPKPDARFPKRVFCKRCWAS